MSGENLQADEIFEFWRWEYLRRNQAYADFYASMVVQLTPLGVTGFKSSLTIEEVMDNDCSILDYLETMWGKNIPVAIQWEALRLLLECMTRFSIFPPLSPTEGVSSKKLLEMAIAEELGEQPLPYRHFVRANFSPFPSTVIRKNDNVDFPSPQLSDASIQATDRFEALFATQHPEIKTRELIQELLERFSGVEKGGYRILDGAPEKLIRKDKKIFTLAESVFQEKADFKFFTEAIRQRKREILKLQGRRIKTKNLARAVGLRLWDLRANYGCLGKAVFEDFEKDLYSCYFAQPENSNSPDLERYYLYARREQQKILHNTSICIEKIDVLPILLNKYR